MLPALKHRFDAELPDYIRLGIHVMVSQTEAGELTIGDSHEYDEAIEPFDKRDIDVLVLRYLDRFLDLQGVDIASRWHGTYVKHRPNRSASSRPRRTSLRSSVSGGPG